MGESVCTRSNIEKRRVKRVILHTQSNRNVRQSIGEIYPQMEVYGIVAGQYHFINILNHIIKQIDEPVDVDISSWTIAKFEAMQLVKYAKMARSLRVIVDSSMANLVPNSFEFLRELLENDSLRLLRNHSKFAVITSKTWNIAIRTSMNLNQNKRLENFEISDCEVLATYMRSVVDEIFATPFDLKSKVKIDTLGLQGQEQRSDVLIDMSDFW